MLLTIYIILHTLCVNPFCPRAPDCSKPKIGKTLDAFIQKAVRAKEKGIKNAVKNWIFKERKSFVASGRFKSDACVITILDSIEC